MFSSLEKSIIRKLSGELPISPEPYKKIADEVGITEKELISILRDFQDKGIIRRICGILYHQEVGIKGNAMVVWRVPKDKIDEAALIVCSLPEVTHCYERPTYDNWPYNFYTMIHGASKQQCEEVIKNISNSISAYDYEVLYSIKELKKSSMKYFE
jgi:DNA-binding Lrp family transcriptional regulator